MDISAPPSLSPASGRLSCTRCDIALPLRQARAGEVPFDWRCTACGEIVSALLVLQSDQSFRRRVQLHTFRTHPRTSLTLPPVLHARIAIPPASISPGSRRLMVAVPTIGLDDCLHPSSAIAVMLSQEISTTSMSLLHVAPWTSPLIAVQLPGHAAAPIQLVLRVDTCSFAGEAWIIRGHFTQRLGTP